MEKLDLELSINNGLPLSDQLIQPGFRNHAVALLVDVNSVSITGPLSIEEHTESHRTSARRCQDEVQIARMEPDRNPSGRLVEHCRMLSKRPDA
jgi:hypothetical protein